VDLTTLLGISIKRAFGDVRLKLSGELDRSNLQALDDAFATAERRARRVVLDLAELTFIDGGGLRAIQQAGERARTNGHELLLENPTPWVRQLLELCELDREVEISGDELTPRTLT
jgi:anti-sigma B factor antagonist